MSEYAGRYNPDNFVGFDAIVDGNNVSQNVLKPTPGMSVTVKRAGTSTLATLYTDRLRSTTVPNPIVTDSLGNLGFWTDPGFVDLHAAGIVVDFVAIPIDPDELAASAVNGVFNVMHYGAVGNGIIDDTVAFNATVTACYDAGGGTIFAPPGSYRITSLVHLIVGDGQRGMDLLGAGHHATQFILDGPASEIRISDLGKPYDVGLWGSTTGAFKVIMRNGATKGLQIGLSAGRTFRDIYVIGEAANLDPSVEANYVGTGVTIDGLNNSTFIDVQCQYLAVGMQLQDFCAGNIFLNYEGGANKINLKFTSIDPLAIGAPTGPENNIFIGGHLEYDAGGYVDAHLHYGAGYLNRFDGMTFAVSRTATGQHTQMVRVRKDGPAGTGHLWLSKCMWNGTPDGGGVLHGIAIDLDVPATGSLVYTDGCFFQVLDCVFKVRDGNNIQVLAENYYNNITQRFRNQGGADVGTEGSGVTKKNVHSTNTGLPTATSIIEQINLDAEAGTGFRLKRYADGRHVWGGGGDFFGDVSLHRERAALLQCGQAFLAAGGLITKVVTTTPTDADMPSSSEEDGALIVEITATGPKLWARVNGGWQPVPIGNPQRQGHTASMSLGLTNLNNVVEMQAAGPTTVTVPPNSTVNWPAGSLIEVGNAGGGLVTIAPGAGVTLYSEGGRLKLSAQFASARLRNLGWNEWWVTGSLTA